MNCRPEDMLLYAVTDRAWLKGETLESQVEKALKGGATFVQLREKELDEAEFLEEAKKLKMLCRKYQVPFVINDNVFIFTGPFLQLPSVPLLPFQYHRPQTRR